MSQIRGSWLSLFAMLMIFIGPLISQAVPMNHHASMPMSMSMSMDMGMDMSAHGEHAQHHAPSAEHHALWEKCGYCTLLFSCPALPHTADISLFTAHRCNRYLKQLTRLGHALQPIFPGARSRAPPVFV
ncbi:DUF2946 domain-containing protein [Pseudomonas sp. SIMBA_077]